MSSQNIQNTIITLLYQRDEWVSINEIIKETGFTESQVRSSLQKTRRDGLIEKKFGKRVGKVQAESFNRIRKSRKKYAKWRVEHGY